MGVFKLQQLLVDDEVGFAESSTTYTKALPVLGTPTVEFMQSRDPDGSAQARLSVEAPGHIGARTARLKFKTYAIGHITSPTGALTETWQQQLLGDALGGNTTDGAGTTLSAVTNVASFTLTTATNWTNGYIGRMGTKGDAKGDGQAFVVSSKAGSIITARTAVPATPANSDVVYGCQMAYHSEGATLVSKRFCVMFPDTGAQVHLYGCQLSALEISYPMDGGKATIDWTYECAYAERTAKTFPDTTALGSHDCAPIAGGSFFIQTAGLSTRAVATPAAITLSIDLGLSPIVGPGGIWPYQHIVGWTRTACKAASSFTIPWVTTYETWFDTANTGLSNKQILFTANTANGRSFGFYLPNVFPSGPRPTVPVDNSGQTYVTVQVAATEWTDTTSALSRASFVLWSS